MAGRSRCSWGDSSQSTPQPARGDAGAQPFQPATACISVRKDAAGPRARAGDGDGCWVWCECSRDCWMCFDDDSRAEGAYRGEQTAGAGTATEAAGGTASGSCRVPVARGSQKCASEAVCTNAYPLLLLSVPIMSVMHLSAPAARSRRRLDLHPQRKRTGGRVARIHRHHARHAKIVQRAPKNSTRERHVRR